MSLNASIPDINSLKINTMSIQQPYMEANEPSSYSNYLRIIVIILLLSLIGFNIFKYLDEITQWFADIFGPIFRKIAVALGFAVTETTKKTIDVAATGAKAAIGVTSAAATSGIDVLQKTIGVGKNEEEKKEDINKEDTSLDRALAHVKNKVPEPDEAMSITQRAKTGKSGYCYIGEDRGFRSCINVGENDVCMSGDIFPTQAVCINPRLRA